MHKLKTCIWSWWQPSLCKHIWNAVTDENENAHTLVVKIKTHQCSTEGKQKIFYLMCGRIMFWILICALSLWYHWSSQKSKEKKFGCRCIIVRCNYTKNKMMHYPNRHRHRTSQAFRCDQKLSYRSLSLLAMCKIKVI